MKFLLWTYLRIKHFENILNVNLGNSLNSPNHLIRQHENSLHCESSGAKVEKILETWSEEIHDEDVVVPLLAVPPDVGDAHPALEDLVQLALVQQLRVASLHTLQLDGNLKSEIGFHKGFFINIVNSSPKIIQGVYGWCMVWLYGLPPLHW